MSKKTRAQLNASVSIETSDRTHAASFTIDLPAGKVRQLRNRLATLEGQAQWLEKKLAKRDRKEPSQLLEIVRQEREAILGLLDTLDRLTRNDAALIKEVLGRAAISVNLAASVRLSDPETP